MEAENTDAKDLKETDSQTNEEQKKPRTVIHIELIKQMVKDNKVFLTQMQQISDRISQHLEKNILKLEKSLNRYEKTLKEIKNRHVIVEETLCNVLLAIRQNEYLQAWYIKKTDTLKDGMNTQYPSTLDECWEVANDGLWWGGTDGSI